jgi:transporter family-2 protein
VKTILLSIVFLLGVLLAMHLAMNSRVGVIIHNQRVSNVLFWSIGALAAWVISASAWQGSTVKAIGEVNPVLLLAGVLGATIVFGVSWIIPQAGARGVFISLIAGQIFGGMVLSQYGWLGSPVQKASWLNVVGALVMLGGVVLATRT